MQNKNLMGHLFALVTILLWGTTFISTKVLLRSFTPIEILFFRFIMGLIVLFLIRQHGKNHQQGRRAVGKIVPGQKIKRPAREERAAEADQLPLGQPE